VDTDNRVAKLFTPPFDHSRPHPGYLMGYPPGIRENGGQYTHAAVWLALAFARIGDGTRAVELLTMMNPADQDVDRYRGEPYAIAADVAGDSGRTGRSGWTWYTGSAGWMYRVWIEEVLGVKLRGNRLMIQPVLPDEWPGFELTYRYHSTTYRIKVQRSHQEEDTTSEGMVELQDDGGVHEITVTISAAVHELQTA
jgi:cyclic beta-1,2-glucan synthetase